jgi:hypothetical protein
MRSLQLSLDQYDSDKITSGYLKRYDPILEPWLKKEIALLELGVYKGGSLLLWRDYFQFGTIVGVDIKLPERFQPSERIHVFEGSQADSNFLSRVADKVAPDGFDIIIDDASHIGELTRIAFWHLFDNHLKPNGLYVIEDWGTGYWSDWPDGKSLNLEAYSYPGNKPIRSVLAKIFQLKLPFRNHSYGMVGFIKQLVDEQGAQDASRKRWSGKSTRRSKFSELVITPSIVFVKKAA